MSVLRGIVVRLRALVKRGREDHELEEELRFHLEQEAQRYRQQGLDEAAAVRRARLGFGGYDRIVEETREARGMVVLENLVRDVRIALRGLGRTPGFTLIALLALTVGIGATTAVFAVASALLFRPIEGIRDADALFVARLVDDAGIINGFSHANITDLRAASPALSGLAGYSNRMMQASTGAGAVEVAATVVDGDYFGVLGVVPQRGRWFTSQERAASASGDVVVISDHLWASWFDRAADVVGRTVQMNADTYTIIGVAPAGFGGTLRTHSTDVWLPVAAFGRIWHRPIDASDRQASILDELVGRLAPGASAAVAQRQLRTAMADLVRSHPHANAHLSTYSLDLHEGIGLDIGARAHTTRIVRLLLGVVLVLLLTACANVANMLLLRGVTRRGETALRSALGASTGRLLQQHVIEGLVLSLSGGIAGVALALMLSGTVGGQGVLGLPAIESVPIDRRVVGFALLSTLLTGLFFTILPGIASVRGALAARLRQAGRGASSGSGDLRGALIVLQITASITLLIGALMLVRTVRNLERVDLGFDATGVHAFGVTPAPQGYTVDEARAFNRRLRDATDALPQVRSAAISSFSPTAEGALVSRLKLPGSDAEPIRAVTNEVSASYFETIGTRLLAGRTFSRAEQDATLENSPGILLSQTAARRLFDGADALGRVVDVDGMTGTTQQVVIGVVEDVRSTPRAGPVPAAYVPIGSSSMSQSHVLVRSALPLEQTKALIGDVVAGLDPDIPFFVAESLGDGVRRTVAEERLLARILSVFAALAVLLAAIGLYSVIGWSVEQRRREIGIRMALGARAQGVVRMVVGQSLYLGLIGGVAGVAGGYALSRIFASRMFGVTPVDPLAYVAALLGFAVVALLASAVPALAATAVDPLETLRQD